MKRSYVFRKKSYAVMAAILDGVGNVFFRPPRHASLQKIAPKKILIVRLDHLGDVLQATALPQVLKENFSNAQIHFLTNRTGEELLKGNPYASRVWVWNPSWYKRSRTRSVGPKLSETIRQLRGERFDLALAPRGDLRENHLLWRIKAKIRVGYGITGGGFFLTHLVPYARGAHESRHTLDLLLPLGIHPVPLKPKLYWLPEEEEVLRNRLKEKGFFGDGWVGIQVGAGTAAKEWPLENLEKLLKTLDVRMRGAKIVFLGDQDERARSLDSALRPFSGKGWLNLVGRTDLRELFYLLKSLRCFIGPDSGPAHVAAACAVPTLFLFSGTNVFQEWRSTAENAHFLRHEVPCSPCRLTECPVEGHPCMSGIADSDVAVWLEERLRER